MYCKKKQWKLKFYTYKGFKGAWRKNYVFKSNNSLLSQRLDSLESDTTKNPDQTPPQQHLLGSLRYEYHKRGSHNKNFVVFDCPKSILNPEDIAIQVMELCTQRQSSGDQDVTTPTLSICQLDMTKHPELQEYRKLKQEMPDCMRVGESDLKIAHRCYIPKIISEKKMTLN